MKTTVSFNEFVDTFRNYGRESSFSYAGKRALFDYLEELEDDCGMDIELDVVALDCEYCEYESAIEACKEYGGPSYTEEGSLEWLRYHTQVIAFNGGVIIQSF